MAQGSQGSCDPAGVWSLSLDLHSSVSWALVLSAGQQRPTWEQSIKQIRPGQTVSKEHMPPWSLMS